MKGTSRYFILIAILAFITDQLSKMLVRNSSIDYVKNYGAGFGILQNQTMFLIIVSIVILGVIIYYYKDIPKKVSYQTFTAFIVGGLIGNLVDRIILGYVVDFITIGFWPSFNIADSALSAGIIGLIIWMLKER